MSHGVLGVLMGSVLGVLMGRWNCSWQLEGFLRHVNKIVPFPSGKRRKSTCEASVDTRNTAKQSSTGLLSW